MDIYGPGESYEYSYAQRIAIENVSIWAEMLLEILQESGVFDTYQSKYLGNDQTYSSGKEILELLINDGWFTILESKLEDLGILKRSYKGIQNHPQFGTAVVHLMFELYGINPDKRVRGKIRAGNEIRTDPSQRQAALARAVIASMKKSGVDIPPEDIEILFWSEEEEKLLLDAIEASCRDSGIIQWRLVQQYFPGRSVNSIRHKYYKGRTEYDSQLLQRGVSVTKPEESWTDDEVTLLCQILESSEIIYSQGGVDWGKVTRKMQEGGSRKSKWAIYKHARKYLRKYIDIIGYRRDAWSAQERILILQFLSDSSFRNVNSSINWTKVVEAFKSYGYTRTPDQLYQYVYKNHPDILQGKNFWSEEDDLLLRSLVQNPLYRTSDGRFRWKLIAEAFNITASIQRTPVALSNRARMQNLFEES